MTSLRYAELDAPLDARRSNGKGNPDGFDVFPYMPRPRVIIVLLALALPVAAAAQQGAAAPQGATAQQGATAPGLTQQDLLRDLLSSQQGKIEIVDANHMRLIERVDMPVPGQMDARLYADSVDVYLDTRLLVASGNVAFTTSQGRISAEKIEFNLAEGTGVFYEAQGIVNLGPEADRAAFGGQDPDVYFWGQRIDKLGPKKYRITSGGFTACVQPTPRWEVTSKSLVLNLDDYALARNTVLRVKGVPLLYLPALYYPLQEGERATGILMPTYGTSTIRGGGLSNAFFWAINRSQDATFFHDWFTRAGQGMGSEYRYIANAGSAGEIRFYRFNQREATFTNDNGNQTTLAPGTTYEVRGSMVHTLGRGASVRSRVEYASSLITQQLYQQDVYRASNPIRLVEGGFSGAWGAFATSAVYQRTEVFSSVTQQGSSSTVSGSTPRILGTIAPTRLFGLPIYGSLMSEYAYLPYRSIENDTVRSDNSLARFEVAPSVRVPLSTLTYLTVNSTASYRSTYYSRSQDDRGNTVSEPVGRTYFAGRSDVIGPVFSKIWDTPGMTTIDRMKHVIEPVFTFDYVTQFQNADRLPDLEHTSDVIVGGSTKITYGLNNRFFSRQRPMGTTRGSSQEFLTIGIQQTYYSNPESSRWDYQYAGSTSRTRPTDLSPIAITTRFSPSSSSSANARLEYDVSGIGLQTVSLGASLSAGASSTSASFSRVVYSPTYTTSSLSLSNSLRFMQGRATGSYSLQWDIQRGYVVSQGATASYLAQCCGLQLEFQQYNFPESSGFPVPSDRRINFGFVLAGLGTFSNFFGAFGGQQ